MPHNIVELPSQKERSPLIIGIGFVFNVVVAEAEPVQPFASVTVTENELAVVTEIVCVVSVVDHKYFE